MTPHNLCNSWAGSNRPFEQMDGVGEATNPYAAVVPKFDFDQAVCLFWKGRSLEELIAAAKRLGDSKLEQDLRKFVAELEQEMDV